MRYKVRSCVQRGCVFSVSLALLSFVKLTRMLLLWSSTKLTTQMFPAQLETEREPVESITTRLSLVSVLVISRLLDAVIKGLCCWAKDTGNPVSSCYVYVCLLPIFCRCACQTFENQVAQQFVEVC